MILPQVLVSDELSSYLEKIYLPNKCIIVVVKADTLEKLQDNMKQVDAVADSFSQVPICVIIVSDLKINFPFPRTEMTPPIVSTYSLKMTVNHIVQEL